MRIAAEIRISGENAVVHGVTPFTVRPADPTGELEGFVMVDSQGLNCVRYRLDGMPVIFTDRAIAQWMATDLSGWR